MTTHYRISTRKFKVERKFPLFYKSVFDVKIPGSLSPLILFIKEGVQSLEPLQ